MSRCTRRILLIFTVLMIYAIHANCVEEIQTQAFGKLLVYRPAARPKHIILFLSGDGGWNKKTDQRARVMTTLDSAVVGIDSAYYVSHMKATAQGCYYPTTDFAELGKMISRHFHLRTTLSPILLGYSLGATLVYGTLVQAPAHTFPGAISMGFCPELPLDKPMCKGAGLEQESYHTEKEKGFRLHPSKLLQDPWLIFQGEADAVCSESGTDTFVKQVPHAQLIPLPNVGHGFRVEKNWFPEFQKAFQVFQKK